MTYERRAWARLGGITGSRDRGDGLLHPTVQGLVHGGDGYLFVLTDLATNQRCASNLSLTAARAEISATGRQVWSYEVHER